MKANLLFHNITEEHNEIYEEKVNHIIQNNLRLNPYEEGLLIEACHRVGPPHSKHARPRPIVARFQKTLYGMRNILECNQYELLL